MITLVGKEFAREGTKFIFYGPADECKNCRYKSSCVDSLEKNRMYEIISVRSNDQNCPLHAEGKVVPVEVQRADIPVLFNSNKVFEGSTIVYDSPDCDVYCEYHDFCFPEGLYDNDKCVIIKDLGRFDGVCKKGLSLNKLYVNFIE
jgi:uncharacterized protein (UPF0179 family)